MAGINFNNNSGKSIDVQIWMHEQCQWQGTIAPGVTKWDCGWFKWGTIPTKVFMTSSLYKWTVFFDNINSFIKSRNISINSPNNSIEPLGVQLSHSGNCIYNQEILILQSEKSVKLKINSEQVISSPKRRYVEDSGCLEILPGYQLRSRNSADYSHAAIYIGNDQVVGFDRNTYSGPVNPAIFDLTDDYNQVAFPLGMGKEVIWYPSEAADRAKKIANGNYTWNYHNINNNCQHFANWVQNGVYYSSSRNSENTSLEFFEAATSSSLAFYTSDIPKNIFGIHSILDNSPSKLDYTRDGTPRWLGPKPPC